MEIVDDTDKCLILIINTGKVTNLLKTNDWNIEVKTQITLILKDKSLSSILHTT